MHTFCDGITNDNSYIAQVLHLLSMKQQQASVVQTWQAVRQSDETIKQGRSIMTFTLVTIVFVRPLFAGINIHSNLLIRSHAVDIANII
jgi:hypothetical protein